MKNIFDKIPGNSEIDRRIRNNIRVAFWEKFLFYLKMGKGLKESYLYSKELMKLGIEQRAITDAIDGVKYKFKRK
jgi:hypothetical protein